MIFSTLLLGKLPFFLPRITLASPMRCVGGPRRMQRMRATELRWSCGFPSKILVLLWKQGSNRKQPEAQRSSFQGSKEFRESKMFFDLETFPPVLSCSEVSSPSSLHCRRSLRYLQWRYPKRSTCLVFVQVITSHECMLRGWPETLFVQWRWRGTQDFLQLVHVGVWVCCLLALWSGSWLTAFLCAVQRKDEYEQNSQVYCNSLLG